MYRNADIKSKEYNLYLQYPGLVIKPISFILFGTIIRQMFFFVIVKGINQDKMFCSCI